MDIQEKRGKYMEQMIQSKKQKENRSIHTSSKTRQLALDAVFVALTLVFTAFVNIQIPSFGGAGGLIHLGNVPLFIAAMLFGKRTGALAGGLGMGLFDLLSGWALWAPCTILTCGLMGFAVGAICEKRKGVGFRLLAMVVALLIKIVGYYVYESFVMGNGLLAAVKSIPGNVVQVVTAAILVFIIIEPISAGVRVLKARD